MAMRANPNTKRFQTFMSRVITSVKTRTQANKLDSSDLKMPDQSNAMIANQSQDSRHVLAEFT